jgi:signal transduction histidine kinase
MMCYTRAVKPAVPAQRTSAARYTILHLSAYLTVLGVCVAEALDMGFTGRFYATALLLAAFTVIVVIVLNVIYRHDLAAFIVLLIAGAAIAVGIMLLGASPEFGAILFFVLCAFVAMRLPIAAALGSSGLSVLLFLLCLLLKGRREWLADALTFGAGYFAIVAFAVAFSRTQDARRASQQLVVELTASQERLRNLAILEERQRLAREMHDAVGHRLTAAAVLLEGAGRLIATDPDRATRMVETSREQVREGLAELRTAVSALREGGSGRQPVAAILQALVSVFSQASEAQVRLSIQPGLDEPDPERTLVIVRTAQEALTNMQKHAAASSISLDLLQGPSAYTLLCSDNGRGPAAASPSAEGPGSEPQDPSAQPVPGPAPSRPAEGGFGLGNLRARAGALGGSVELSRGTHGGAVLRLTLPIGGAHA